MNTITIGGKARPISFKMSTLAKFLRSEGIDADKLLNIDLLASMHLVYYGLADGARKDGKKVDFTKDDVLDWIDEDGVHEGTPFTQCMEAFGKSMQGFAPDKPTDEISDEVVKN